MPDHDKSTGGRVATILVIDNERAIVRAIEKRLVHQGFDCLTPGSVEEALMLFSLREVNLVITDLDMPGVDGLGLITLIRKQSDVPVLIVTGFPDRDQDVIDGLSGVEVIAKPFESDVLAEVVRSKLLQASVPYSVYQSP